MISCEIWEAVRIYGEAQKKERIYGKAQKKKAIELFSKRFHDKQEISIEEVKQILIKNLMGVKE